VTGLQQFALLIVREPTDDQLDVLFTRCGDITVEQDPRHDAVRITFDREAPSLVDAIVSAVRDLEVVGLDPTAVRDDDDLVTLADIAERVGRSPEAVRLWTVGRTGPGGFPQRLYRGAGVAFYRWSLVAPWLQERMGLTLPDPEPTLTAINLALALRALSSQVPRMDAVRSLLAG